VHWRVAARCVAASNFGKGQLVAADYTMNPSITFSQKGTGGAGAALGGLFGSVAGAVAGGLKSNEASTTLLMIDNRSGVQLAAAEGSAKKFDFSLFGGVFGEEEVAPPVLTQIRRRERFLPLHSWIPIIR